MTVKFYRTLNGSAAIDMLRVSAVLERVHGNCAVVVDSMQVELSTKYWDVARDWVDTRSAVRNWADGVAALEAQRKDKEERAATPPHLKRGRKRPAPDLGDID